MDDPQANGAGNVAQDAPNKPVDITELAARIENLEQAVAGLTKLMQNEIEKLRAPVKKALEMVHSIAGVALPPEL